MIKRLMSAETRATGDKATAARRNELADEINKARNRWGLAQNTTKVTAGDTMTASDINTALTRIREAKNTSGWTGTIEGDVTAGVTLIYDIITPTITAAQAITNHCPCFGNCSGSCTGTCTGTCSNTCTGDCTGTCSNTCTGTCNTTCNTTCSAACKNSCMGSCGTCGAMGSGCTSSVSGGSGGGSCGSGNKRIVPTSPYYIFRTDDILDNKFWKGVVDGKK